MTFPTFAVPTPRARLAWRDWLVAAIFFLFGLWLFTRHNDFPSFYHPDEPSKARQVIEKEFNFNHPMSLLQATRFLTWAQGAAMTPQPITEAGRAVSAFFTAGAVACLVLLAAHLRGTLAGVAAGLLVGTNSQLYDLAHYMKEDPSLLFGMAVFFLFFVRCWLSPSPGRFLLLGVGAALAISGKYIGALVLPIAFLPLLALPAGRRTLMALFVTLAFLGTVVAVNYPMLTSLSELASNVGREADYAVSGHKGLTRSVPHGVYGKVFREATNPAIWVLLGCYYAGLLALRRRIHPSEWVFALFPIAYVLLLSFSPKTHHRYFLPDTAFFCTLAALAPFTVLLRSFGGVLREKASRVISGILTLLLLVAVGLSVAGTVKTDISFRNDARRELVAYIEANIPRDATIVQDKRVNLPRRTDPRQSDSPYFLEQPVLGKLFAADVGTIADLRARGIHYIAVSEGDYNRFFLKTHKAREEEKDDYDRRKAFYEELFAEGQILWERPSGDHLYLQPQIRLYYLP